MSRGQDSFVVIIQQVDYDMKHQNMIEDGNRKGIYSATIDTILYKQYEEVSGFPSLKFQGQVR